MSEYQYYEFLAIDQRLSAKQMTELRRMSTRAEITPVSFTNEYHWGDFKGNPATLMERYFDAHIYFANWCTCVFALRLPHDVLDRKTVSSFRADDVLFFDDTGDHWVVTWALNESQNYDRFGEDDGRGWMTRLIPLRDELLRGDLRPLYLGWLAAVIFSEIDDERLEPIFPIGFNQLTAAQTALAEFIEVDPDLLAGTAMGTESRSTRTAATAKLTESWLTSLPQRNVIELLKMLLTGRATQAERELKTRYADWQRRSQSEPSNMPYRRVAELRKLAADARLAREAQEAAARVAHEKKQHEQRSRYLASLAADFDRAWKAASQRAERGTSAAYDDVRRAIVDLAEAYAMKQANSAFETALRNFVQRHTKRGALVKRLVEAGLWKR